MAEPHTDEPVHTSLGRLRVTFGWNRWGSAQLVDRPAAAPLNRVVSSRRDLVALLTETGLARDEAVAVAGDLWRRRDRSATRLSPGTDVFGDPMPWYSSGTRSAVYFLIWVAVIAAFAVVMILGAR